jgi:leucyl/phenylalanyl-tRNA--protein transferase
VIDAYTELHHLGLAHSVESWHEGRLVGGLYGVALGGAFFGESMFSRMNDASKVSFVALVQRLRERDFSLLDTQYINDFTASLGAIEISDSLYQRMLEACIDDDVSFR